MFIIAQGGRGAIKLTGVIKVTEEPIGFMVSHVDVSWQHYFSLGIYQTEEKAQEALAGLIEAIEYGYRSFRMPEEEDERR